LRKLFYKDRSLLAHLAACAKETLFEMFKVLYSGQGYMPGIITFKPIKKNGDALKFEISSI